MCRIYGHIATALADPSDYLYQSSCSLLAQSVAKSDFKQKDGWGIAALKKDQFRIIKSAGDIYKEKTKMINLSKRSMSQIVIAHIRAASNPLKLSMKKLIAPEHSQPFGTPNLAFCHNGSLNIADAARKKIMGKYRLKLKGNNDSEIYFWLFMKWYSITKDVQKALTRLNWEIWDLWNALPKKERAGFKTPYTGFNLAISDGIKLYALCHSINPVQKIALCLKDQPYNRLAYRLNPTQDRFIVGSEKMSRETDWKVAPMHSLLVAQEKNGKIVYQIKKFQWKR